jgi:Flp pilus assembly protein TadG
MLTGQDAGAVTVEAAISLVSLVVVLTMVFGGAMAVGDQLRCTDAAGEAARLITRGQRQLAEEAVRNLAPSGSRLAVRGEGDTVTVEVSAQPLGGLLPGLEVRAEAYGVLEPGEVTGHAEG